MRLFKELVILLGVGLSIMGCNSNKENSSNRLNENHNPLMQGADPFILTHENKYYLYFTDLADGFKAYSSDDLINWTDEGYALKKGEGVIGNAGFWAPEIIYYNNLFYMVYVADEHLAIATSSSPTGPFTQNKEEFISTRNMIDGHFFLDDDGKMYLYYVRFISGANVIFGAEMNQDMTGIVESTEYRLISASEEWEISSGYVVAEGPFILKRDGKYYLSYSCNHCKSPDYAIGYAVSDEPLGGFKKYENNPILSQNEVACGVGHHSFFNRIDDGHLMAVYHRHFDFETPFPRKVCIDEAYFDKNGVLCIDGPKA